MSADPRRTLIEKLQAQIDSALGPHLAPGEPVALVDFPNHPNAGDSAIWAGEIAYLRSRGVPVGYTCDFASFAPRRLRQRIGEGTILLHGGGSVGDIWEETQAFRERVVATFPSNRIVQLPQTIHFQRPENLERARSVFDAHPGLTLLARDRVSLENAREGFETATELCTDMAFAIGPLDRHAPSCDVLWLSRTDAEAKHALDLDLPPGVETADWLEQRGAELPWRALRWATQVGGRRIARREGMARPLSGPLALTQGPLANQRVRAGARILSRGRAVVTDRLHGHILSLLLGIPHVLLDNSYGKLRNFYDSWTSESPLAHFAGSPEEALTLAVDLAREGPPQ